MSWLRFPSPASFLGYFVPNIEAHSQGIIRNPLGCDATLAMLGRATPTGFSDERQMLKVLDESMREEVVDAMTLKRLEAARMFGDPS